MVAKIENVITLLFLLLLWIAWILPHGNKSKQYEQPFISDLSLTLCHSASEIT